MGRRKKEQPADLPASQKGLQNGYERISGVARVGLMDDLKAIAYWDRLFIKDVITEALEQYIERWKEAHPDMPLRSDK